MPPNAWSSSMRRCPPSPPLPPRLCPGAPRAVAEVPGNLCMDWHTGDAAAVDAAFARAAHVVTLPLDNHRIVTNPMEPRGAVGTYDAAQGPLYAASSPARTSTATATPPRAGLACRRRAVRFVAPDVGGGFGAKNFSYAEHALMLWAAKRVGRPVKWIATRGEVFLTDHQARDHRGRGGAGARCGGKVPGAARRQHCQSRRLHGGRRRRRADQPICASARHGLRHSGDRAARPLRC